MVGRLLVITGASGGMGLKISKELSNNNISVLMLDLQSPNKDFLKKRDDDNRETIITRYDEYLSLIHI